MTVSILLPQFFLPQESIKLGRFTTSVDHPHQNYHDPACANPPQTLVSVRDSYTGSQQTATSSGFGSALTSLMSVAFSKRAKTKTCVVSDHVRTYMLGNSDGWFDEATVMPATRSWIERQLDRGYKIYVVVGFHTLVDARIVQELARGTRAEGQAQLPANLVLAAVGAVAPLGNIHVTDPRIGGHHDDLDGGNAEFLAAGEQVCALQYRKLRHRWLSGHKMDQSHLSKLPRWSSVETWRDVDGDEDDIIEVELTEALDLGGEWERKETAESDVLLVCAPG
ncbi:hypothetical protein CDD83_9434 [Cordyceps sp. RAO-2017]|nr:hypothetical protein CDD83_9434 [Cordyceps sp. RAO-2017]